MRSAYSALRLPRRFVFALVVLLLSPSVSRGQCYLTATEVLAVGGASVGLGWAGLEVRRDAADREALIDGPIVFDRTVERWIAGASPRPGQTNFLDNAFGSAITPAVGAALLVSADLTWPRGRPGQDALQDLFLFTSGLLANKGINDAVKGVVARPRPYVRTEAGLDVHRAEADPAYDRHAFYSGHTSSAFFVSTFVDKRLRSIMRARMSPASYDNWKWLSSTLLYGWAAFVGGSRIHALKHHATDVLAGAAAGVLFAELFYALADEGCAESGENPPVLLQLRFAL